MILTDPMQYFLQTVDRFSARFRKVSIGKGTRVGRGTVIRDNVKIGRDCYIGDLCVFMGQTTVGDKTCINAQCHITRFSRIGSHVFIAHFSCQQTTIGWPTIEEAMA